MAHFLTRLPPTSDASSQPRLLPGHLTDLLQFGGSRYLRLKKSVYSRDHWFTKKDITQEEPDGRDAQGRVYRKGTELPCRLRAPLSSDLHMLTSLEVPKSCPFGFLWRLCYTGLTDFYLQPPLPPKRLGGMGWWMGLQVPTVVTGLGPLATNPHP